MVKDAVLRRRVRARAEDGGAYAMYVPLACTTGTQAGCVGDRGVHTQLWYKFCKCCQRPK